MIFASGLLAAKASVGVAQFHQKVEPLLEKYCYQCHGDGASKGQVAFDTLTSDQQVLNPALWSKVLNNLRSGLMPPQKKPRPTAAEEKQLEDWIKFQAFAIDPRNPDPGRVTLRRLNRTEYHNTIRDLLGVDFNTEVEFPPDDTGYGFDNIGDVLSVSPLLLEKYMLAATTIVDEAVPKVARVMPVLVISGSAFSGDGTKAPGNFSQHGLRRPPPLAFSFYETGTATHVFQVEHPGTYHLALELSIKGTFEFDPGKCRVIFKLDDQELLNQEFTWEDNKIFPPFKFAEEWQPGTHRLSFQVQPLAGKESQEYPLEMRLNSVTIAGPLDQKYWTQPTNYDRFFTRAVPADPADRRPYAREILGRFAQKAFRRPVESAYVDRLLVLAESVYAQPGESFETGVAQAMVAVLSSPRFLFRSELPASSTTKEQFPLNDEYSLASRLSYFLWSSMPDDELFELAAKGQLRNHLGDQLNRMLADPRSESMVNNFTGQWLQVRDVEGVSIDSRVVLARDRGEEKQLKEQLAQRRARFEASLANPAAPSSQSSPSAGTSSPASAGRIARRRNPRFPRPANILDAEAKHAMQRETQMVFSRIVHEDRSILELIDSDYTYLNQQLAGIYGLTNLGVTGPEMRRVTLPPGSPRGGVLTEGTVLVVTSNPDRTSPVKRGLFVLSHILGSPPPPPPPNVPALEATENHFHDREPTLREILQAHRDKPECFACHSRLDPLGLAFENFNALGMWREQERHQDIIPAGQLISGESFTNIHELKHILVTSHHLEFYRCLVAKLLTYAIGRGTEYYDTQTIDQIVNRLDAAHGRFSVLLYGIIDSAPFQRERRDPNAVFADSIEASPPPLGGALPRNPTNP